MTERGQLKQSLEDRCSLKTFIIGVGNCGNQIIALGFKENMDVYAINTSIKDLSDNILHQNIPSFIIGKEGRGTGKNIQKGEELWKENGKELFSNKEFLQKCQDADTIVVASATGGGTGPSISPKILRVLIKMFPRKIIMYAGVTPKNTDSNTAFANTAFVLDAVKNMDIPYILTDLESYKDYPNDEAFLKADTHVIECVKAISGLYLHPSNAQMIDENDMKSVIGMPGYLGVYFAKGITSAILEKQSMQSLIVDQIKASPSMAIQKDGISVQMAAIVHCPDDLQEVTRSGNYQEIFDFVGHKPKNGIYENYSVSNGTDGYMIVILSGMTYPINRINYYIEEVKRQDEFIKKQKTIDTSDDIEAITSLIASSNSKLSVNTTASDQDILNVLEDDELF